jgi:hypothetical protein
MLFTMLPTSMLALLRIVVPRAGDRDRVGLSRVLADVRAWGRRGRLRCADGAAP